MPLKVYRRPGSEIFYIRGKVQHFTVDRSARTASRGEAEAIKAKIEADLFKRAVYGERAVATFDEAVARYLKAGGSPDHLDALLDRIGHRRLSDIGQEMVDDLAREMKPKAAPATLIRQIYTPILAVMNQAASDKLCDPIRLKKPKVRTRRTEYLTPQEVEDWLDALPDHLKRIITFYVGTGCRATEGLSLIWKDVTLGERRAVFWDTKEDYARGVDLQPRVRDLLPGRGDLPTDPVFLNSRGEPWHGYDAINLMLKRIHDRRERQIQAGAELPPLAKAHCHLFRHTWATWAYAVTRDMTYLMTQAGWRSATMVMRYTHAPAADLATAILEAGWEFDGKRKSPSPKRRAKANG